MNSPKLSASILREHSEHLRKLTTSLSEDLSKLRLALSEQERASDTEELSLLVGLVELNQSHFLATDLFSQRLHALFEKGKSGNGATT
jgi:hypothetical protein